MSHGKPCKHFYFSTVHQWYLLFSLQHVRCLLFVYCIRYWISNCIHYTHIKLSYHVVLVKHLFIPVNSSSFGLLGKQQTQPHMLTVNMVCSS